MEEHDINQLSLRQHMSTLRVFLKWAASIEAVPPNLYDKVMVPQAGRDERQRDDMLEADEAGELLEYLSKYHFASRRHVIIALLWETGIRVGAANSIDLADVYLDEGYMPTEVVSDRMNVSRDVLDHHYDRRSDEVKLEQRRGYLEDI